MQSKIAVYALVGLGIALWPIWIKRNSLSVMSKFYGLIKSYPEWIWKPVFLAITSLGVIWVTGERVTSTLTLNLLLISLATSFSSGKINIVAMLTSFLALCISTVIPWWQRQNGFLEISNIKLLAFGFVTLIFVHLFSGRETIKNNKSTVYWIVTFTSLATILTFSTGILVDDNALLTQWHHWSAYIASAELLLSGATIFRDFPVQYGLGPTTLIASLCGYDCWIGMYFIAGLTTLISSILIAALAFSITDNRWSERLAVTVLCLATCFFWTAYPPNVASPLMTPSVSGLRFLPAVLLVTYLFFSKKIEESKFRILCAHGLWVLGAIWSPESAFYVTFVWWPYYLFIRRDYGNSPFRGVNFLTNSGRLFLMCIALIIIFNIIFRIIYHEGPTLYGFLAYAIHPPGPMPINIHGGIWYFLFAMAIGVSALFRSWFKTGDTIGFRRGFLVQLLSYSVFSYFLGRSHDNNLLNIMPFVLLVLLNTISSEKGKFLPTASIVLTATFIGWVSLFGWNAWDANLKAGKLFQFDYKLLRDSASLSYPDTDFKVFNRFGKSSAFGLPQDAGRAITFLRMNYGEPVTVLDFSACLEQSKVPEVWSAIHDPANFTSIPSSRRKEFLYRTAKSLKRSGWLIVDRNFHAEEWLADFDFAYERTTRIEFGTYYAIRYRPKESIKILNGVI